MYYISRYVYSFGIGETEKEVEMKKEEVDKIEVSCMA